jgi:hypothetical protein
MRPFALILSASFVFVATVHGQALTEHAAAAAGATIGTAAGKSLSNSLTNIFGETDKQTAKAAKPDAKKESKPVTNPAPDPLAAKSKPGPAGEAFAPLPASSSSQSRRARKPIAQDETAAALPPEVDVNPITIAPVIAEPKVPTVEDIASIQVGTTESDLLAALGPPSSHVIIPDDDGHLREICQYFANGQALGTVRLDNGQVASVETRRGN